METRRICRVIAIVDIYVSLLSLVSVSLVLTFMGIATYSGNQNSILESKFGLTMSRGDDSGTDDLTKAMKPILGLRTNYSLNNGNATKTKDQWLHDDVLVLATWMLTSLTLVGTLLSLYAAFRLLRGVRRNVSPAKAMIACRLWWNVNIALLLILVLDLPLGRVTGLIFSYIGLRSLAVWLVNTYINELNAGNAQMGSGLIANGIGGLQNGAPSSPPVFTGGTGNGFNKPNGNIGDPGYQRLKENIDGPALVGLENVHMNQGLGKFAENVDKEKALAKLEDTVQENGFEKLKENGFEKLQDNIEAARESKTESNEKDKDMKY